jgi:hypothetical protein
MSSVDRVYRSPRGIRIKLMVKCKIIGEGKFILVLTGWAQACLVASL